MPIYEYTCSACGKKFDALVFRDEKVVCEACGSGRVKKGFSAFAVHGGPTRGGKPGLPSCAGGCGGGFDRGACGSGMCGG
jgi:putative FmdB family regulatory protein